MEIDSHILMIVLAATILSQMKPEANTQISTSLTFFKTLFLSGLRRK